ncbi:ATP-binding protein [Paracoccus aerodenitrificans]|uniref:ATP-binding protein n=1 Tax=Paracoccus aerodenitrificans TaxID=3017781 RepID=UPI0022F0346F|nr:ATP-binding protein [Paracoccus aerodenitrificans]WBU65700.1 ATP-binding protein [Paracoccus aerodenitrificans]
MTQTARNQWVWSLSCDWIKRNQNVLITGKSGTGKTWLGCCLGMQAIRNGISVSYRMVSRILEEFELAHLEGTTPRLRAYYKRADLLILDDFGVSKLKATGKHDLLELLDDRIGDRASHRAFWAVLATKNDLTPLHINVGAGDQRCRF